MMSSASPDWALFSGAWVLTYLLHSTLLLGGVWLLLRWRRVRSEALRETLWKFALIAGVITATLQVGFAVEPLGGRIPLRSIQSESKRVNTRFESDSSTPSSSFMGGSKEVERESRRESARDGNTTADEKDVLFGAPHERGHLFPNRKTLNQTTHDPLSRNRKTQDMLSLNRLSQNPLSRTKQSSRNPLSQQQESLERLPTDRTSLDRIADSPGVGSESGLSLLSNESVRSGSHEPESPEEPILSNSDVAGADRSIGSSLLSMIWAAGALIVLFVLGLAWLRLRKLLRGRDVIDHGPLREQLDLLCEKAAMKRKVTLSACHRARIPMAVGIFRPEICLPVRALDRLNEAEQTSMLAHELAHLKFCDPFWLLLFRLLESLLFFQPLNRFGRRAWQELAEYRSDAFAAALQGNGLPLAQCLTRVAEWVIEPMRGMPAHGMAGNPSSLKVRVRRLLNSAHEGGKRLHFRWQAAILIGLLVIVTGAAPGVGMEIIKTEEPSDARPQDDDETPAPIPKTLRADTPESRKASPVRTGSEASFATSLLPEYLIEIQENVKEHDGRRAPLRGLDEDPAIPDSPPRRLDEDPAFPGSPPGRPDEEMVTLSAALKGLDEELAVLEDEVAALKSSLRGRKITGPVLQLFEQAEIRIEKLHQKREQIQDMIPLIIKAPESEIGR